MFKHILPGSARKNLLPILISLLAGLILIISGCRSTPLTLVPSSSQPSKSNSNRPTVNKIITATEAKSLMVENQGSLDFVILDVRTAEEFDSGHLPNARNFDIYKPDFKSKISELERAKNYLVYCRTGSRSAQAVAIMSDLGFQELYDLSGGITQWIQEGNSIVK
jgi:rhodanese-related sulfurtransferase